MGFIIDPSRCGGYPTLEELPDAQEFHHRKPYPELLMRCFENGVNGGYPCIPALEGVSHEADVPVCFFGRREVSAVFMGTSAAAGLIFGSGSNN